MIKHTISDNFGLSIVLSMTLTGILLANAQTNVIPAKNVLSPTKDSVINKHKYVCVTAIESNNEKIYQLIDKCPEFPGGEKALLEFINQNIRYPIEAQRKRIQGRVIIRFVITEIGKVGKAEVVRGLDPEMDQEALRVINSLPDWIPGELNGEKVVVYYSIPVTFKLNNDNSLTNPHPKKMPL